MKYKKRIIVLLVLVILGFATVFSIDLYVKYSSIPYMVSEDEIKDFEPVDYILILGAGLKNDGTPSLMLEERLNRGIVLYNEGVSSKVIVSGDHMRDDHDEVNAMKEYMVKNGVPSTDIFMDHAGFSTYDSLYRAKEIFNAKNLVIVTQKYHLYRALYIGNRLGLEVRGSDANIKNYSGQAYRDTREILARVKDFLKCTIKPTSMYLGDVIPDSVDGNYTNDKEYIIVKKYGEQEDKDLYISDELKIEKVKSIIDSYEFTDETCDGIASYVMNISSEKEYGIEVYSKDIHIILAGKEITLSKDDSQFIKDLILP